MIEKKTEMSFSMLASERRVVIALALIYMARMLGLFMLIPVMALYAGEFSGASSTLIGVAVGVYGLTQAVLQIPFVMLSDRWGRHVVITLGLLFFLFGGLLAAFSESIYQLILGRALQGAGAVAAAVMALVADSTRESQRSKAMAILGASIGLAFVAALVIGPVVYVWVGGRGLFLITATMALIAIALLWGLVPCQRRIKVHANFTAAARFAWLLRVIVDKRFLLLNTGIFCLHSVLTASFVAVPLLLRDQLNISVQQHWLVYLFVMVASLAAMFPGLLAAERRGKNKMIMLVSALFMLLALLCLGFVENALNLVLTALILFFAGFNALEAVLPSLVSKQAPPEHKGAVMGAFSTCQFAGVFTGGLMGGMVLGSWGLQAIFMVSSGIIAACLIIVLRSDNMRQSVPIQLNIE
jgi:MFS family permease